MKREQVIVLVGRHFLEPRDVSSSLSVPCLCLEPYDMFDFDFSLFSSLLVIPLLSPPFLLTSSLVSITFQTFLQPHDTSVSIWLSSSKVVGNCHPRISSAVAPWIILVGFRITINQSHYYLKLYPLSLLRLFFKVNLEIFPMCHINDALWAHGYHIHKYKMW